LLRDPNHEAKGFLDWNNAFSDETSQGLLLTSGQGSKECEAGSQG
jgi:hypothetical protein